MITITEQKPWEEVSNSLEKCQSVYIIGCGTCTTALHTGGKTEVIEMKKKLEDVGKKVSGWMVIPTACDDLTKEALAEKSGEIDSSDCILVMSCAFGVQTVSQYSDTAVFPAVNTLFIGKEQGPGEFLEVCAQCGNCVLGETAGICPVIRCTKGLLNGPCGGTNNGKCEVDSDKDCAWTLIYERLEKQGRLDLFNEYHPPRNFQSVVRPGKVTVK